MQENRVPGERPDRHPAAGIWERTSPRFHRDRSRRDACPTRLCGPHRKIIRLKDKRGIYLFLIEITAITAITKYLAAPTADPGEFCVLSFFSLPCARETKKINTFIYRI